MRCSTIKKHIPRKTGSLFLLLVLLFSVASCKKFIEVDPPVTGTSSDNVYTNDATAAAVLTGMYTNLSRENISASLSIVPALTADELSLFDANNMDYLACYTNSLTPALGISNFWSKFYNYIFACNDAIEGLEKSAQLTPAVKQQLLGEAKFMRAFMYFYLVNYYGAIPLAVSTDYKVNTALERADTSAIYTQIISDLTDARTLLSENYVEADAITFLPATQRVRPSKWAAIALLSRVYLYHGDFADAEAAASELINNAALFELAPLNDVFLKSSKEAIWQLQVVGKDYLANTEEGRIFVLPAEGPGINYPVYLSPDLVNAFDAKDQRRTNWINSVVVGSETYYYANKYKIGGGLFPSEEYPMILRLAEQYLIRAEARIRQNKVPEGIDDLNVIRARATNLNDPTDEQLIPLSASLGQNDAQSAVENERRYEFFTEFGHRWLDLKRFGHTDAILGPLKGNNWQSTDKLFPIPQADMQRNPSLKGYQNPGYN